MTEIVVLCTVPCVVLPYGCHERLRTYLFLPAPSRVLHDQRKVDEAASMEKEAPEKRKRILGEEHADTITASRNLEIMLKAKPTIRKPESSESSDTAFEKRQTNEHVYDAARQILGLSYKIFEGPRGLRIELYYDINQPCLDWAGRCADDTFRMRKQDFS